MKSLKTSKLIIFIIIFIAIVITLGLLIMFSIWAIGGKQRKNRIMEIGEQKGYKIEFENNREFCITESNVKYYYKSSLGKMWLTKIYTEVPCKTERQVVDDKGQITITIIGKDSMEVALDDYVIEENARGIETNFHEHIYFVCSSEFTLESIDTNNSVSILGKASKYYNKITTNFITSEELRELYENGVTMAKEFMES